MKRRLRIEITAVRRRVTVTTGNAPAAAGSNRQPDAGTGRPACPLEASRLLEPFAQHDGDSAREGERPGPSPQTARRLLLRLWGTSLKRLTEGLGRLRARMYDRRLKPTTGDADSPPPDREGDFP